MSKIGKLSSFNSFGRFYGPFILGRKKNFGNNQNQNSKMKFIWTKLLSLRFEVGEQKISASNLPWTAGVSIIVRGPLKTVSDIYDTQKTPVK